jgi:hypothetical protein
MPRAGFKPATPATKRPQTYTLDRSATGIGELPLRVIKFPARYEVYETENIFRFMKGLVYFSRYIVNDLHM